jgi:hypothetical protein
VKKEGGQEDGEDGMTRARMTKYAGTAGGMKEWPLLKYIYGMMPPVSIDLKHK